MLFMDERSGGGRRTGGMEIFGDFVDKNDFLDVQLVGARFTWSNFQERPLMSHLDCFLIFMEWDECFSPTGGLVLPRPSSDHSSIMLQGGSGRVGAQALSLSTYVVDASRVQGVSGWMMEILSSD